MKKRICGVVLTMALLVSFFALFAVDASAASNMRASQEIVDMIQAIEGFQAIPYWDYAQWTVGFGTECPAEDLERYKAEGIPVDEAQALFAQHMVRHENAVNKFIDKHGLTLTQAQFDALISYTYNLGPNTLSKDTYTIVEAIVSGATGNELIYAFSIYCMAGGEFQAGLMRRRLAEADLWFNGVYSDYPPQSYCYVLYDANGGVRDASAQGYDCNMPAVPMSRPTKEGYTFVGWYTAPEGGVKITSLDETHHGITLYAHWEEGVKVVEAPTVPAQGINVTVTSEATYLRSGPGIAYGVTDTVCRGEVLTITGTTQADGLLWGKCSNGWISLEHTSYFDVVTPEPEQGEVKDPIRLPEYATIVNAGGVTVYNGPHTTYPKLSTLAEGSVILLEEYTKFAGKEWVRYEGGWIQLSTNVLVHDETKLAHNFTLVATSTLAIRVAPGVENEKVTTLKKGATATVYAIAYVDGVAWGRIAKGWINMTYSDFDEALVEQYQNHAYGDWYSVVASTCQQNGTDRRDCQYCTHYETKEAELGAHAYESWKTILEPTCTADGQEQRSCSLCGNVDSRAISATGHAMTEWTVTQEANCVDAGQEQRQCENCGHTEKRQISPLGHSFGAWYETKAPTASEYGEEKRDCATCGYSETRALLPTEHSFGDWYMTKDPTCLEAGTQQRDCKTCDHYEQREVEALGHSLGQWYVAVEPGCTQSGQERRDCQRCDHNETREMDPTGHSYGEWYESIAPTIEEYGQERRDCAYCDSYETRQTDKLPIPTIIRTYATITCDILRVRSGPNTTYVQIGRLYKGDRVEILELKTVGANEWGRIENGWICLTGYATLETVEEGPHLTHTYGEWYMAKEPTCTETGERRRDCTVCEHFETEVIQATDHSFGDWYVSMAPTTTAYGQERRDCKHCDHYETRELPMLEETLVTKVYAIITCDYLTIRSGPGSANKAMGRIMTGARVEILEQVTKNGVTWGRTTTGWIWLSGYTRLETVTEAVSVQPTLMTVNADSLTVRVAAGTGNAACGYLYTGAQVLVYETVTVKGTLWARTDFGWVMAKYLQ